jgi:hypothetical protein
MLHKMNRSTQRKGDFKTVCQIPNLGPKVENGDLMSCYELPIISENPFIPWMAGGKSIEIHVTSAVYTYTQHVLYF